MVPSDNIYDEKVVFAATKLDLTTIDIGEGGHHHNYACGADNGLDVDIYSQQACLMVYHVHHRWTPPYAFRHLMNNSL
jgi:hypothetical protein